MMSSTSPHIVHPLRRLRTERGLSLRQLGDRATVDHRRLHLYEHGLRMSPLDRRLLAVALGVRPEELG